MTDKDDAMELVDFSHTVSTDRLSVDGRLSHSGAHVVRGVLEPNEGGKIGGAQLAGVVHMGEPFNMERRLPASDRLQGQRIELGDIHMNPGYTPFPAMEYTTGHPWHGP
jgi:AraC family transcriptional regulator